MVKLYSRYRLKRQIETLQIFVGWCLSYLWVLMGLIISLGVVLLMFGMALVGWYKNQPQSVSNFVVPTILLLLVNLPVLHMFIRIRRHRLAAKDLRDLKPLPKRFDDLVRERITALAGKMEKRYQKRLTPDRIRLFLEEKNHKATPCMITKARSLNLIFPLGFFKVFHSDPEAADAMLAHELAHFLHRDSGLLLDVRSFFKGASVIFYYLTVLFALVLIVSGFRSVRLTARIWSAEAKLASIKSSPLPTSGDRLENRLAAQHRLIQSSMLARESAAASAERAVVIGGIIAMSFPLLYYCLLFLFLRRRIRRSEELADLFALMVTQPGAVTRFLSEHLGDERYTFKSLHPSIKRRLNYARRYEQYVT